MSVIIPEGSLDVWVKRAYDAFSRAGRPMDREKIKAMFVREIGTESSFVMGIASVRYMLKTGFYQELLTDAELQELNKVDVNDKWEYMECPYSLEKVNELGLSGWQLCSITLDYTAVLKRKSY
jgi:hypothetical protein